MSKWGICNTGSHKFEIQDLTPMESHRVMVVDTLEEAENIVNAHNAEEEAISDRLVEMDVWTR